MGRTAGTPNKITKEVRGKLDNLINSLVNSIDLEELDINQRIKMLQIALQYTLPRLQVIAVQQHEPESEPFTIQVLSRKEDSDEENWKDNFEVTSIHKVGG